MYKFIIILLILIQSHGFTGPVFVSAAPADDVPDLIWHRFKTKEFEILSINENQGKYVRDNVQFIKNWIFERWQLKENDLALPCQIFIVPDNAMFVDFFRKQPNIFKIVKDKGVEKYVLWLSLPESENWYNSDLPEMLTYVCLTDYAKINEIEIPYCIMNGMALLNRSVKDIQVDLKKLKFLFDEDLNCFWINKGFLKIKKSDLDVKFKTSVQFFGPQSEALCLLLRKEFGASKFVKFLNQKGSPDSRLIDVYEFKNKIDFDSSYKKFMEDLLLDINNKKIPDDYLTW